MTHQETVLEFYISLLDQEQLQNRPSKRKQMEIQPDKKEDACFVNGMPFKHGAHAHTYNAFRFPDTKIIAEYKKIIK